jgi:formylglycine-generating enzyme required for sulfatase activity
VKTLFRKEGTRPVGQKMPNLLGVYDMLGNVNELCWDCKWTDEYAKQIAESIFRKVKISEMNGPETGNEVYYLGGSWCEDESNTFNLCLNYNYFGKETFGNLVDKTDKRDNLGFRVILPHTN